MMFSCIHEIRNIKFTLTKFRDNLTEKSDINKSKTRILNDLRKLELAYSEYVDMSSYPTKANLDLTEVKNIKDVINDMEDIESFISILSVLENIDTPEELEYYNTKPRMSEIFEDKEMATLLSPIVVETIASKIKSNRELKVFDPRCKEGDNMRAFKRGCPNTYVYGLEKNISYANNTKDVIDRCIKGGLLGSKISNDVFDILFLVPEVSWEVKMTSMGTLLEREEKSSIRNTIKYLRPGGLFLYTIPYYRLTKEISLMLSKLLSEVDVIKHTDGNAAMPYLTIVGYKNITKESRQDVFAMLSNLDYEAIPLCTGLREYIIEGPAVEVQYFRGSILDDNELEEVYINSGLYDSFWEKQDCSSKLTDTKPLLPFNIGQIGLVLTSGCLDGVIEEYEGQYHAIKGMVTKVKKSTAEASDNNTHQTVTDVYSNIVQINIFGPDGEFIELA